MENFILDLLKKSGADGWAVRDEVRTGWEFYFIRHALDQNRVRETEHITLTIYKAFEEDGKKYLGSASAELAPTATETEAERLIRSLLFEAGLIRNPAYTLTPPCGEAAPLAAAPELRTIAGDFLRAMKSVKESAEADINSYEIFTDSVCRRLVTSTGIDVTDVYPSSMAEVVVNARDDRREIELYRMYKSGSCDAAGLKANVEETLRFGRDKLRAGKTPALGRCDVVFSTDDALEIYDYYIDRMNAGMVYQGISDCEIGKAVAEDKGGDKLTVRAVKTLENSSHNGAFDDEGAPVRDMTIISGGVAENFFGRRMFASISVWRTASLPATLSSRAAARPPRSCARANTSRSSSSPISRSTPQAATSPARSVWAISTTATASRSSRAARCPARCASSAERCASRASRSSTTTTSSPPSRASAAPASPAPRADAKTTT